jgi:N-acetyl-beta-hexosaminidase
MKSPIYLTGKYYTIPDLQALVIYAQERGVEVIPEVDMPAHTYSWGQAFNLTSMLLIECHQVADKAQTPLNIYPLDISNDDVYLIIEAILTQIVAVFPSPYLHIGGDEVEEDCYKESTSLLKWAKRQNISLTALTKYFETKVFAMVYRLNKTPMVWQGVVDGHQMPDYSSKQGVDMSMMATARRLSDIAPHRDDAVALTLRRLLATDDKSSTSFNASLPKAVVMPWKCWGGLALRAAYTSLQSNHPVVYSACWYLDGNADWTSYLSMNALSTLKADMRAMKYSSSGMNSSNSYSNVPSADNGLLFGGEASAWTELMDHSNIQCRIYPRLGAIAYRLWGVGNSLCLTNYISSNASSLYAIYHAHLPGSSVNTTAAAATATSCQLRPTTASNNIISLNVMSTKLLYSAYLVYHHYLAAQYAIKSAEPIFHVKIHAKEVESTGYLPYYPASLYNSLQ